MPITRKTIKMYKIGWKPTEPRKTQNIQKNIPNPCFSYFFKNSKKKQGTSGKGPGKVRGRSGEGPGKVRGTPNLRKNVFFIFI
jgi:hypothetical protein